MPRPRRPADRPAALRAPVAADDLRHAAYAPSTAAGRRLLLAEVKAGCEDRPGTYRMLGATGLVLYVGKAKRLRTRLLSYFRSARANRRRDKQARILRHAHGLEWEYAPSEFAALLRELRLIKRHRPRFNVLMNVDEPPRGWIAVTGGRPGAAGGAVPALRVVHRTDAPDAAVLYGPFRRLHQLAEAARALADATGVRDCDAAGPAGAAAARGQCLRAELGACACPGARGADGDAPGGARGDAADAGYAARVGEARDFLAGRTRAPVDVLRARMLAASEAWQFERAAVLRERVAALEWLAGRLERFHAGADRLSFLYRPASAAGEAERVYLVRRGTVRAECAAPATDDERLALDALARRVFTAPDPADLPTHDLDEFYLVASWFRRHPDEHARTAPPPAAG
jgi:excinuclease UvrABC nuclease subunit